MIYNGHENKITSSQTWSYLYRLVSGLLQLAEGSHLTIDETLLQTGTLNSTGFENAQVLKNMMETQKVHFVICVLVVLEANVTLLFTCIS